VLLALAVVGVEADAQACSLAAGGIYDRTVWPGPDTQPPVNTRVIVRYGLVSYAGLPDQQPPAIGPDLVLLDGDGTIVPATSEVVGYDVILRPDAPLLPNHAY
jgi:hypothetical protein